MNESQPEPGAASAGQAGTAQPVACAWCGSVPPGGSPPITWASSVEAGVTRWFCETCARENLRSIEGKLDSAWW